MGGHADYRGILRKTYLLLQYAVSTYDVSFILKTDDDAFVNPPWLAHLLRNMCGFTGCCSIAPAAQPISMIISIRSRLAAWMLGTGAEMVLCTSAKHHVDSRFW